EGDSQTTADCSLCKEIVKHKVGVTSNYSRDMQRRHLKEFTCWTESLKPNNNDNLLQLKITDALVNKDSKYIF
ncbi:unnamed protein product, partial [Didymodactylos carnosus]